MTLFIKDSCKKCEYLKPYIPSYVDVVNVDTKEGYNKLISFNLVELASRVLPILVDSEGVIIIGALLIKKRLNL